MKKFLALLMVLAVTLCGCAASKENPPSSSENPPPSSSENPPAESVVSTQETDSIIPANYEGKTEFVGDDGEILSLEDADSITELYTSDFEDGTHTVFRVDYDAAWFRESTGISYNSADNPELFTLPKEEDADPYSIAAGEYTGPTLDPAELPFHKVKAGDTYKGYRIKEAATAYDSLSGYPIFSTVVFEGELTLKGYLSYFDNGSKFFFPYGQKTDFLPILAMGGGLSLQENWSFTYAQIDDDGNRYFVAEGLDDSAFSHLIETGSIDDTVLASLKAEEGLDVEIIVTELTLLCEEGSSRENSFKIKSIRALS